MASEKMLVAELRLAVTLNDEPWVARLLSQGALPDAEVLSVALGYGGSWLLGALAERGARADAACVCAAFSRNHHEPWPAQVGEDLGRVEPTMKVLAYARSVLDQAGAPAAKAELALAMARKAEAGAPARMVWECAHHGQARALGALASLGASFEGWKTRSEDKGASRRELSTPLEESLARASASLSKGGDAQSWARCAVTLLEAGCEPTARAMRKVKDGGGARLFVGPRSRASSALLVAACGSLGLPDVALAAGRALGWPQGLGRQIQRVKGVDELRDRLALDGVGNAAEAPPRAARLRM